MVVHNEDCLGMVQSGTSAEGSIHFHHRADENNYNKSFGDVLGSVNSRDVGRVYSTDGRIWPTKPDLRNLGIGHNRICAKADKVDSNRMIKDQLTRRRTFGKYRIVIPTKEEWGKNWPINRGKGMSGLQMEPVISKGPGC